MAVDPINSVKTLLEDSWTSGNTDSITPNIDYIWNWKRVDLSNKSAVLLYAPVPHVSEFAGIGSTTEKTEDQITIDIRTIVSRDHANKLRDEVHRIVDGNIIHPDSDYHIWRRTGYNDLTDRSTGLYRYVIETVLEVLAKIRAT